MMITVVLYGITGGYVSQEIKNMLSEYGVVSVCGTNVEQYGKNAEYLIVECAMRAKIKTDGGIIVMIGEISDSCVLKIPQNFLGVVYSSDVGALKLLMDKKIKTVTCGMSNKDTIILSSVKENTASVCLQRKITSIGGKIIEPSEFPFKSEHKITDYALMASYAILLLSGNIPDKFTD